MNFTINGLEIGSGTDFKIASAIEGLETPPIRTSSSNYSGKDGGLVNGQFLSPRLITIPGFIAAGTCEEHEDLRKQLQESIIPKEDLEVIITTFSGTQYVTTVRVIGFNMPIIDGKASKFKIDLFASDPNLYLEDSISTVIPIELGGGFVLPFILPVTFAAGSSPTIINNTGSVDVFPVITITGESTNPIITKTDTGEKVEVTVSMHTGDVLEIDMFNRTITLNGSSIVGYRTSDSDWFSLDVGANHITYESDDLTDTGVASVTYRIARTSI